MTRQTQQIMHLMEIQLKYGLSNVLPEDEMTDFDVEKNLNAQNKIDTLLRNMELTYEIMPESVQKIKTELYVVDKIKLNNLQDKVDELKQKC